MSEKPKDMERRDYLKYLAAVVVGLGVGGAGGYMSGSQQAGPVTEVTETKTVTVTGEAPPATQPPTAKQFEGQNVVIQIEAGWQEEQYHYYGKIWTENTGGTLTVVGTPVGGTYEKLITEFVAGTGAYDIIYLLPIWSGDIMGAGYLLELDNYFAKADPWLDDIMPAFKESYMKWGGKWYGITADGDVLSLYYRRDLFGQQDAKDEFKSTYGYDLKAPETMEEYLDAAKFWTRDTTGDGKVDFYGCAIDCMKGEGHWWFIQHFGALGGRWFNPDTMEPEVNSGAGIKALETQVEEFKYSPPGVLNYGYTELRDAFFRQKCAMVIQWPDLGGESEDPEVSEITGGKTGFALTPGGREVWNNDEGRWDNANDLPSDLKSVRVINGVHHATSLAYGATLCITKTCKYPDAAYDFMRYFTSPEISLEVVTDKHVMSGLDPWRISHFDDPASRVRHQWYGDFLDSIKDNIAVGYPDLRILGSQAYWDSLFVYQQKAITGEMSPKAALDACAKDWERTTDEFGREDQRQQWLAAWVHTPWGP